MKIKKEIPVKVAVVQMEPKVGEVEKNLASCLAKVNEAADNGAQLIVLPCSVRQQLLIICRAHKHSFQPADFLSRRIPAGGKSHSEEDTEPLVHHQHRGCGALSSSRAGAFDNH